MDFQSMEALGRFQHADGRAAQRHRDRGRLPKIVSAPIADAFEAGSQRSMLRHIVTGLRHLCFRLAFLGKCCENAADVVRFSSSDEGRWRP